MWHQGFHGGHECLSAGGDISTIGQIGVGFFSACWVSDKVRVISKNNDDEQYTWEPAAGGSFTVQKDTEMVHGEVKRGTKIICYLKEDRSDFREERRLMDLVKKHSGFIGFPVEVYVENAEEEEITDPEEAEEEMKDEEEVDKEKENEEKKKETKNVKEVLRRVGATQQEQASLDAKVGGCDERRVRIFLPICCLTIGRITCL